MQQEKATAVNLGSQLREETRRLQQRLDSLGADHDAALHLYKQQVSQRSVWVLACPSSSITQECVTLLLCLQTA